MKSKKEIKKLYPGIKEMYENGITVLRIAKNFDISKEAVYNAICRIGISRKAEQREQELKKLTYADNRPPILERLIIDGKRYTDITPLFAPR